MLSDEALRGRLGAAGRARAAEFPWDRAAEAVVEAWRGAVGDARARLAASSKRE